MSASTLEIAQRAGISEASIFKRFTTKQALFLAAIGVTETPHWVKVMSHKVPSADIKTELTSICGEMFVFYQKVLPQVMMMMAPGNLPELTQSPPPPIRDSQLLAEFLELAIEKGHLKPFNSTTIAHMIVGGITNYIAAGAVEPLLSSVLKSDMSESSQFVHNLIETLWAGISIGE